MNGSSQIEIGYEILAYLIKHPNAQDTMKGIMEWWLLEQKIEHEAAKVKNALGGLVAKHWILERKGKNSSIYYRINQDKYKEIQTLLNQRSLARSIL